MSFNLPSDCLSTILTLLLDRLNPPRLNSPSSSLKQSSLFTLCAFGVTFLATCLFSFLMTVFFVSPFLYKIAIKK